MKYATGHFGKFGRAFCFPPPLNPGVNLPVCSFSSGEHLRICPQGYTCCTSEMEENLAKKSRSDFEDLVRNASRTVQAMLKGQHDSFDSEFEHSCAAREQGGRAAGWMRVEWVVTGFWTYKREEVLGSNRVELE